nr:TOMM precursor leader peptide-binding protein [Actinacidiphila yeochonensis]
MADRLAVRAAAAGRPAPAVAALGARDLLGPDAEPEAAAARRAAARVHLAADAVLVGPWGGDGAACGCCLAVRWQRLRTRTEREALETGTDTVPAGSWPTPADWTADAVWALLDWTTGGPQPPRPDGAARVTRLDLETGRTATVPLLPEPLCPRHEPPRVGAEPYDACAVLGAVPRPTPAPGRYRLRGPASYRLPADALANPVCGVLGAGTWLDVTSPTTAPVAGSVFMRGYAGLTDVTWSGQANSFAASRDLAFLEGLERYAGTHRRSRTGLTTASYEELVARGEPALDPRTCGLYGEQTYREDPMVSPFDPARPLPWVRGHSLREGRPVLVPARLVHYGAGTPADDFVFECSNGCAIGSCPEEAVLFGLLELVERDAFLLGWYGDAPLPAIDLASCGSPELRAMTDRAALCGYDVHVFDNRVDLPVPVATGLAVRRDGGPGTFAFAAGAALDPMAAVESAVAEILTYLPHLPRQVAERPEELEAMAEDFSLVRRLPDHAALFGLPRMREHLGGYLAPPAVRTFAETYAGWADRRPPGTDLREALAWLTGELAAAGHDVIAVDQTTPEQRRLGLSTVCTIVPGLLPIDFGWARQRALTMPRLRTAQRRAGMRPDDLPDAAVRAVPHPFP